MSNNATTKLQMNEIHSFSKKDKRHQSPNKLNIPDVYDDQDGLSDNNSFDSQTKQKRNRKKNHKKQQNNVNKNSNGRRDKYGNEIIKGGKKHKIQFSAKIQEVRLVENWKIYNSEDYEAEGQKSSCCFMI